MIDEKNGAWSMSEVQTLLRLTREKNPNFYVFLLVSILHGLRVSETCTLRKRDFIVIRGETHLRVQRLKGSMETTQVLYDGSDPLLDENSVVPKFIYKLNTDDLLFNFNRFQADRLVKKYCALAGIDAARAHMHCCKHTLGVLMRKARRPIEEIAKALGHANINNTYRAYMGVRDEDADFARAATFAAAEGGK